MTITYNNGNYTVAKITTPIGVMFTARTDNRSIDDMFEEAKYRIDQGEFLADYLDQIYKNKDKCSVENIYTGMAKSQAISRKAHFISDYYQMGWPLLNNVNQSTYVKKNLQNNKSFLEEIGLSKQEADAIYEDMNKEVV
jgi:hypothetical protein